MFFLDTKHIKLLIDWCKAMSRMDFTGYLDTLGAIVEVWTSQAFVSNTNNGVITTIAHSFMSQASALLTESLDVRRANACVHINGSKGVRRMMTMFAVLEAEEA